LLLLKHPHTELIWRISLCRFSYCCDLWHSVFVHCNLRLEDKTTDSDYAEPNIEQG